MMTVAWQAKDYPKFYDFLFSALPKLTFTDKFMKSIKKHAMIDAATFQLAVQGGTNPGVGVTANSYTKDMGIVSAGKSGFAVGDEFLDYMEDDASVLDATRDGVKVSKFEPLALLGIIIWGNMNNPKNKLLTVADIVSKQAVPFCKEVYGAFPTLK